VRVIDQQTGEFADAEVGFIADRYQFGETDTAAKAARHQAAHHAARLRHDGEAARRDVEFFQHRIHRQCEMGLGAEESYAVGTDQPRVAAADDVVEFLLFGTTFGAGFGKTVAVHRNYRDFFGNALFQRHRYRFRRNHDKGVIHLIRYRCDIGIGPVAEHFGAPRIHRYQFSGIAMATQVTLRSRSVFLLIAGSANQRDGAGIKDGLIEFVV
jgi:hypothetical protein